MCHLESESKEFKKQHTYYSTHIIPQTHIYKSVCVRIEHSLLLRVSIFHMKLIFSVVFLTLRGKFCNRSPNQQLWVLSRK